ncbi:MAG: DUF1501 domain-containing protein [Verrucomicrobiota bacterium]
MKTRREFLKSTVTAVAAGWTLPSFIHQTAWSIERSHIASGLQAATGRDNPILVILQLGGGNDGLNTVVPFAHDAYYTARPNLAVKASSVLKLGDEFGLNPALSGIKSLYDSGNAAIINGVGYPNPNRSHFRSMEIWHTASDSNKNEHYGWLGNYFDNTCQGSPEPSNGISIGNNPPQAFHGKKQIGISMTSPKSYQFIEDEPTPDGNSETMTGDSINELNGSAPAEDSLQNLDFLRRTTMDAEVSSETIHTMTKAQKNTISYPQTKLGRDLSLVAQLIAGGMPTRVYYVNHGGFDTHANQQGTHTRLITEFSNAVSAFCSDLKKMGHFDRVLMMSFSEFGRRVKENGSRGTDHGVAGPTFLFGGNLKGGCYGKYPSLTDLTKGDLKHNTDFRSIYSTILDGWLKTNSQSILKRKFPHMSFI